MCWAWVCHAVDMHWSSKLLDTVGVQTSDDLHARESEFSIAIGGALCQGEGAQCHRRALLSFSKQILLAARECTVDSDILHDKHVRWQQRKQSICVVRVFVSIAE